MKKRIKLYAGIGLLCLFLLGCSKGQILVDTGGNTEGTNTITSPKEQDEFTKKSEEASSQPVEAESRDREEEQNSGAEDKAENDIFQEEQTLWVHICGQVTSPGVYELPRGSRIWDALQAAGGVTYEAAGDYLNQASLLEDGMKITVPSTAQVKEWNDSGITGVETTSLTDGKKEGKAGAGEDSRINLNTADEATLCTLPGIGASRARSIIAYREKNGPFVQIEDVMKVSGIKEAAFAKIKEYIRVS